MSLPTSVPPSYGSRSIVGVLLGWLGTGHEPVHVGGRFSWNARMPSRWSSVANRSKNASRSARSPALSGSSAAARTDRLAARTASGGIAAIAIGETERRVDRLRRRDDGRDETGRVRLVGRHRPAGQDQVHGPRHADRPRQTLRPAGAGHDPDPDLGLPELRIVAGHDEVARHGQLAAAPKRIAADRRDERDADRPQSIPRVERPLRAQPLRGLVGQLDDVGTGGERPVAGTGQDDDPRPVVAIEVLERVGELRQQLEAERVARLRADRS